MHPSVQRLRDEIYRADNAQLVCDLIIGAAVSLGSSDIHIEALTHGVRVRYRIDGVLTEIVEYQLFFHQQIVARFKILANLKIDESRMPQDGRISTTIDGKALDLRISTLPTVCGEKIVMRIVDKSKKIPELTVLGIEGHNGKILQTAISQPNGIILTSGPTGSGKSTTLYSCLNSLNGSDVNIMTLEDPVENTLDGINQSQVFPDIGYTFASGLRTALRQDPDIIMVGEIRDKETINIAIEASLTGHLVLSTIHTNSAADTVTRILNMGIQSYLLGSSINAIIAQRLIRKLCTQCRKSVAITDLPADMQRTLKGVFAKITPEELQSRVSREILEKPVFYEPVGCEACNDS